MKVLLLAHVFPPYNASGSVRAAKLAEHLTAKGHDVRVLTGEPHPLPRTLATTLPRDRVITTTWARVEAPLDALRARIGQRLRPAGLEVPAPAAQHGASRPSLAVRAVVAYRSLISVPDAQAGWIAKAVAAGRRLFETWRPELIYSTALPFSSHVAAARLARIAGCPWVGEFRDLYSGNPYSDLWALRARLDTAIERRVMKSAAAVVSVSPPLTDYVRSLHGKPAATIMNGYDAADFARAPDMTSALDPAKVTILYTGIIYPGRRDPAVLLEALARLGPERHRFEVRFYGQSLEAVPAAARRHGVADVVRIFGSVPYLEALGLQKAADILLLLLWDSPLEKGVLTGKLFEYACAGKPVLSLGCTDGAAADLIREHALGLATNDPDAVARFLMDVAAKKAAPNAVPQAAAVPEDLSRRAQFDALERFLAEHGLLVPANAAP